MSGEIPSQRRVFKPEKSSDTDKDEREKASRGYVPIRVQTHCKFYLIFIYLLHLFDFAVHHFTLINHDIYYHFNITVK